MRAATLMAYFAYYMSNNLYTGPSQLDPNGKAIEQRQQQVPALPTDLGIYKFGEAEEERQRTLAAEQARNQLNTIAHLEPQTTTPNPERPAMAINQGTPVPQMPPNMDFDMNSLLMSSAAMPKESYQAPHPRQSSDISMGMLSSAKNQFDTLINGPQAAPGQTLKTFSEHKDAIMGNTSIDMSQLNSGFGDQTKALLTGVLPEEIREKNEKRKQDVRRAITQFQGIERKIFTVANQTAQEELRTTQMQETQQTVQKAAEKIDPSKNLLSIIARLEPRKMVAALKNAEGPARHAVETATKRQQQQEKIHVAGKSQGKAKDPNSENRPGTGGNSLKVG